MKNSLRFRATFLRILPRYDIYEARGDWLNQKWSELIVG